MSDSANSISRVDAVSEFSTEKALASRCTVANLCAFRYSTITCGCFFTSGLKVPPGRKISRGTVVALRLLRAEAVEFKS